MASIVAVRGSIEARLGTLVSTTALRLLDISRTGCLLETTSSVEAGATGRLSVAFKGRTLTEEVRITRCQRLQGSDGYYLGAEFLRTRRPHADSLRVAFAAMTVQVTPAAPAHALSWPRP